MNPGYFAFVSVACFAALVFSGWDKALCGGIGARRAAALLAGWALALMFEWRLREGLSLNGGLTLALLLSAAAVRRLGSAALFSRSLAVAALTLLWHAYALQLKARGIPLFDWQGVGIPAGEAAAAGLMLRQPAAQFAALTWGLAAGEFFAPESGRGEDFVIGGASFWDSWWPAFLLARAVSLAAEWLAAGVRRLASRIK